MKKYRKIFLALVITIIVLVILGVLACLSLYSYTGDKELKDFSPLEMQYFAYLIIFLITLFIIELLLALYGRKNILPKIQGIKSTTTNISSYKYLGIEANQYSFVWFDIDELRRAKIKVIDEKYYLFIDQYNKKLELWSPINSCSVFDNLTQLSQSLYFEYNFECYEMRDLI